MHDTYDLTLAAAAVRGHAIRCGCPLPDDLARVPLEQLSPAQQEALFRIGQQREIPLYRFKRGHEELPRVRAVLGTLKNIYPESLVDVGSGRGVFLFPFLDAFPWCQVTSLDVLPHRVEFLEDIRSGGVERLRPMSADICAGDLPEKSADVVTMLEVLEHIPDVQRAVSQAVRLARRFVVVSVPSKPDNNPEHIHLLTKDRLTQLFANAGCTRLRFSGVNGHLILVAAVE